MKIRVMTVDDYGAVYALWMNTQGMGVRSLDDSPAGIERFLRRNPNTSFVAYDADALVGVILCGHDGRRGYIYHAAVDAARRGAGIGRALVNEAVAALKREGILKAALVAFAHNEAGNVFWEKLGFTERSDLVYRNMSLDDQNVAL